MNAARRRTSAFTLLELLLAMGMVALLAATLYAALNAAYKGKRAAERAIGPIRTATIAMDLISRDLESMVGAQPLPELNTTPTTLAGPFYGENSSGGNGDADWIEFYSIGTDAPPATVDNVLNELPTIEGMRRIDIGISNDVDPPALVRRVTRNLRPSVEVQPEEEIICRNVRSFSARYFDGVDTWWDEWDSTTTVDTLGIENQVPALIELEIVFNVDGYTQPGGEPNTYRVRRLIPIAITKPQPTI